MVAKSVLKSKEQTGDAMYRLCSRYNSQLDNIFLKTSPRKRPVALSKLTLKKFYDFVRQIPYKQDKKPIEVIGTPFRLVELSALDCKKKAVLIGCYAKKHGIPYRFMSSSTRKDKQIHHVFPELLIDDQWIAFDATYPNYCIGMPKHYTKRECL